MSTQRSFSAAAKAIEDFSRTLDRKVVPSGLRQIGEEIMTDVRSSRPGQGVPRDEGVLAASGRVDGPKDNRVELSFGGAAAPYALRQHEELQWRHTVGEARYLVRGVDRWKPFQSRALMQLQADAIKAAKEASEKGEKLQPRWTGRTRDARGRFTGV